MKKPEKFKDFESPLECVYHFTKTFKDLQIDEVDIHFTKEEYDWLLSCIDEEYRKVADEGTLATVADGLIIRFVRKDE